MKKKYLLLWIFPLFLILSACTEYQADVGYQISGKEFVAEGGADGISIIYPIVSRMDDPELQNKVNWLLYESAVGYYLNMEYYNITEGLSVHANYEVIYKDDDRLSVVFSGEPYVDRAAHPFWDYRATNIDLTTGEVIYLEDIISYTWLRQCFDMGEVEFISGIKEIYDISEGIDWCNSYINSPFVYGDDMHMYDYYFDNQKIYLIVRVPHPYGDYIVMGVDLPK